MTGAAGLFSATVGDHRGRPAHWLAATVLACAALYALSAVPPAGRSGRVYALLTAAVLVTVAGAATSQTPNSIYLATPLFALAAYDAVTTGTPTNGSG